MYGQPQYNQGVPSGGIQSNMYADQGNPGLIQMQQPGMMMQQPGMMMAQPGMMKPGTYLIGGTQIVNYQQFLMRFDHIYILISLHIG